MSNRDKSMTDGEVEDELIEEVEEEEPKQIEEEEEEEEEDTTTLAIKPFTIVPDGDRHLSTPDHRLGQMMYYKDKLFFNTYIKKESHHRWVLVTPHNSGTILKAVKDGFRSDLHSHGVKSITQEVMHMLLTWEALTLPLGSVIVLSKDQTKILLTFNLKKRHMSGSSPRLRKQLHDALSEGCKILAAVTLPVIILNT
ncbi:uncharacterized protein ACA1_371200 [Acanthamoeba castellanii str. Neff]|uniref:Uncharacterized protein n=1 Tax=Acanthamoeba castellanii (strain ATCC 30010 / Neff) TaxID=1257118 RepID=L8GZ70_ACACF|nr:uncharacterized protein ACA1_371200 [Acanthamoeba castellanii str. Neff]ELR18295.1 hypothetical protein ACA1_371200 [Acanthamoeba castellanii str. Neff]